MSGEPTTVPVTFQDRLRSLIAKWRDEGQYDRNGHMVTLCAQELEKLLVEHGLPADERFHDARVSELLEANNREVARRRAAEATVGTLRAMLLRIEREGVPAPATDDDQITALAGRIVDNLKALGRPAAEADQVEQDRAEWDKEKRW